MYLKKRKNGVPLTDIQVKTIESWLTKRWNDGHDLTDPITRSYIVSDYQEEYKKHYWMNTGMVLEPITPVLFRDILRQGYSLIASTQLSTWVDIRRMRTQEGLVTRYDIIGWKHGDADGERLAAVIFSPISDTFDPIVWYSLPEAESVESVQNVVEQTLSDLKAEWQNQSKTTESEELNDA